MNFKHVIHTAIKIILPLFFGLLLIWFLYRGVDFSTVWSIIKEGVRYDIILFSLVFGLMANIVRALRWGLLIESLGGRFKTSNIIFAVLGNYAVNLVLPRIGEIWRCGIVSKYDKISYDDIIVKGLKVMDTASCALCKQNHIPIIVFDFAAKGSISKLLKGEKLGTIVGE